MKISITTKPSKEILEWTEALIMSSFFYYKESALLNDSIL